MTRRQLIIGGTVVSCANAAPTPQPTIEFTRVPQADASGSDKHDIIEGTVAGARKGQQIVLYAKNGSWWLQPLLEAPFTRILPNGKWRNATHLGSDYAALLVDPGYRPDRNIKAVPTVGGLVSAVSTTKGALSSPSPTLQFSGYEWRVRTAVSNRGGRNNQYSAESAWTDSNGALHLAIKRNGERFDCAEVALTRSLGYGTYSFSVRDVSRLAADVALEIFTWDYSGTDQNNREMDVVIRRQQALPRERFIVQPYNVGSNVYEFYLPPGAFTHSFRWEPGQIEFGAARADNRKHFIAQHNFTLGVPAPGLESARMALYLPVGSHPVEAEVVIDRFEYTP